MKKVLVKCYEGNIFVEAPRNTKQDQIINAVKHHHNKIQLANVEYLTESKWEKLKHEDMNRGQEFLWEDMETIKL